MGVFLGMMFLAIPEPSRAKSHPMRKGMVFGGRDRGRAAPQMNFPLKERHASRVGQVASGTGLAPKTH